MPPQHKCGNARFYLHSCNPAYFLSGLSPWSNTSTMKGSMPNTLSRRFLPQASGFPTGIQLQNQGLVYHIAQSSLFLQNYLSKYIKLLQLTATYVCGNCILFLAYFSLQAKNNSMNVQRYEDYSKLRALRIWMKASAEGRVVRVECRYFSLRSVLTSYFWLIHLNFHASLCREVPREPARDCRSCCCSSSCHWRAHCCCFHRLS